MKAVSKGKFSFTDTCWSKVSDQAKDFISQLLTLDQEKRPSAADALKHPWITELSKIEVDESLTLGALGNLKSFKAESTMKQATYAFIAAQLLSKGEKDNLAKVFRAFDTNGDGKLSMEEIKTGYLEHYGKVMSDEEVEKMFSSVDTDNSGFIDYSEFVVAAMNERTLITNERLAAAFKMFDKDGSGIISSDEIKEVLGFGNDLTAEAVDKIVKEVDKNGDGEISFEEFVTMMKKFVD